MAQVLQVEAEASRLLALDVLDDSLRRLAEDLLRFRRRCAEVRAAYNELAEAALEVRWHVGTGEAGQARLSRRERLVAALAAAGRTNSEIAAELHVSLHTVKSQMRSVLHKLEISSRWQLATLSSDRTP